MTKRSMRDIESARRAAAKELARTAAEPYRTGGPVDTARRRRAARALVQATAEEWIRAGEALDMHRRMHDLANEVEGMGHPAHADRLRALADDLLKETRR